MLSIKLTRNPQVCPFWVVQIIVQGNSRVCKWFNELIRRAIQKDPLPDGFFDVLTLVIKEKSPAALSEEALPNEIVRTVLEKMFDIREGESEQELIASVGPITRNLAEFVERVHHAKFSSRLLHGNLILICRGMISPVHFT